eukprot:10012576-Alexandrium_andersonii.AAC.1
MGHSRAPGTKSEPISDLPSSLRSSLPQSYGPVTPITYDFKSEFRVQATSGHAAWLQAFEA